MKDWIMFRIIMVCMLIPMTSDAFEYEVDMPNSGDPKMEMVRIKIDDCTSKFFIPKKEFESFSKDADKLTKLVKKALERSNSNCPN